MTLFSTTDASTKTLPAPYGVGCFLCCKPSDRVVLREGSLEGRRCECGLVYTHPLPSEFVNPLDDLHFDEFYEAPARIKANWLAKHCPPGRLVEVGCGMGFLLLEARNRGYDVTGIEPNPERAAHVRDIHGIEVDESFLHDHNLQEENFDVVYHCDLLSHFAKPDAALKQMTKLLRPGGVLCLEVGTLGGLKPWWYPWVGGVGLKYHLWLYSKKALVNLFDQAGLEIAAQRRYGLAPQVLLPRTIEFAFALLKSLFKKKVAPTGLNENGKLEGAVPPADRRVGRFERQMEKLNFFLRYYVGRIAPAIGPQTYFFVLTPKAPNSRVGGFE